MTIDAEELVDDVAVALCNNQSDHEVTDDHRHDARTAVEMVLEALAGDLARELMMPDPPSDLDGVVARARGLLGEERYGRLTAEEGLYSCALCPADPQIVQAAPAAARYVAGGYSVCERHLRFVACGAGWAVIANAMKRAVPFDDG